MSSKGWIVITIIVSFAPIILINDFCKDKQAYNEVIRTNTIESCDIYISLSRNEIIVKNYIDKVKRIKENLERKAEKERLEQIEAKKWSTDDLAWSESIRLNTSFAYKKYIELYPAGLRIENAKKLLVDREVDDIFGKDHGKLPNMDKISQGHGDYSTITVYNNTAHTLTLRYSGAESTSVNIASRTTCSLSLTNGSYRIAASVDVSGVRNYAGNESLTGGHYNVEYYISNSSRPSYSNRIRK